MSMICGRFSVVESGRGCLDYDFFDGYDFSSRATIMDCPFPFIGGCFVAVFISYSIQGLG